LKYQFLATFLYKQKQPHRPSKYSIFQIQSSQYQFKINDTNLNRCCRLKIKLKLNFI